jgi:hypothetical protein
MEVGGNEYLGNPLVGNPQPSDDGFPMDAAPVRRGGLHNALASGPLYTRVESSDLGHDFKNQ